LTAIFLNLRSFTVELKPLKVAKSFQLHLLDDHLVSHKINGDHCASLVAVLTHQPVLRLLSCAV